MWSSFRTEPLTHYTMLVSAVTRASLHPALMRLPVRCGLHTSPVTRAKLYSAKHEWVELVGGTDSDTVRVGVTRYAAEALGDVVYAQLPREEEELEAGGEAGAVESVKAASEIYSPVSGTVTQHNIQVDTDSSEFIECISFEVRHHFVRHSGQVLLVHDVSVPVGHPVVAAVHQLAVLVIEAARGQQLGVSEAAVEAGLSALEGSPAKPVHGPLYEAGDQLAQPLRVISAVCMLTGQ